MLDNLELVINEPEDNDNCIDLEEAIEEQKLSLHENNNNNNKYNNIIMNVINSNIPSIRLDGIICIIINVTSCIYINIMYIY